MSLTISTTTTITTSATATSTCHAKLYDIPTKDAACAMPMNSTYLDLMTTCCGSASILSYSDCDYYCLAQDQTVGDLAECLIKGSRAGGVWCNTNANATATATGSETGGGTVVATATGTKTGTEDEEEASATETGANGAGIVKTVGVLVLLTLGSVLQVLV
ncbi:hypothetical protein BDV12DRAFT_203244 [Aspergillus spectabilis]